MGCRTGIPLLQWEDRRGDDLLLPPEEEKVAEFWLQANVDFDYKAKALEPYAREDTKLPSISHKVA
jgi:hypothetical protein